MRFDTTTALITGAASGIGAATARRLASEGARVVVADLDVERAEKVAADIGGEAIGVDVCDPDAVRAAFAAVADVVGPIDVLVNNAGGDRLAFFLDTTPTDWRHVLGVNLEGTMACTHAVLRGMYERRRGSIVNVASEAGRTGVIAGATYAAAKAGILGFTKAIARESARYGVRCNAVAPGPIDTPMLDRLTKSRLGAHVRDGMIGATVLGRAGTPDEVAGAIAYLASDDASFVTGETISVSGGAAMT